jgi:indolepyruvate ferredoxin oxidoreductase beta subunit
MNQFNIVLAGVGGQGTLLAAEIIGAAAVSDGLNVRVSEIHGMAQRGGAVTSNVRIGIDVLSPMVIDGGADVLLGFEPLETIRCLKCASRKTLVITSSEHIPPSELAAKNISYPTDKEIQAKIHLFTDRIIFLQAAALAKEAGNSLAQNSVLLGALAAVEGFPLKTESLLIAMKELVPQKHVEVNTKAFMLGMKIAKRQLNSG